jgi:hypothetical protein
MSLKDDTQRMKHFHGAVYADDSDIISIGNTRGIYHNGYFFPIYTLPSGEKKYRNL